MALATTAVRGVNWVSRRSGRGAGTVAGGNAGLGIDSHLLAHLARGRTVALVTGTNGKTTTTAMMVRGWGREVATNTTGANMPAGHVAALAASRSPVAALECDERWLPDVIAETVPAVVVVLNLSRDQLDRAAEVRQLAQRWRDALKGGDFVVVANARDPLVVYAASASPRVHWCAAPTSWTLDARSCPVCTRTLDLGADAWSCTCGFAEPPSRSILVEGRARVAGQLVSLDLAIPGPVNRGNALLALAALHELGVDPALAARRLATLREVEGRYASAVVAGQAVRLLLAKNPAGFAAQLADQAERGGPLWIAINDGLADGRDPSWLYDVDFEQLRGRPVWCWGTRRLDLAARLWYAGIEATVVEDVAPHHDGTVDLIANYTAFQELRREAGSR